VSPENVRCLFLPSLKIRDEFPLADSKPYYSGPTSEASFGRILTSLCYTATYLK
jgi:hypothetical protein